jgi:hypothetical protein
MQTRRSRWKDALFCPNLCSVRPELVGAQNLAAFFFMYLIRSSSYRFWYSFKLIGSYSTRYFNIRYITRAIACAGQVQGFARTFVERPQTADSASGGFVRHLLALSVTPAVSLHLRLHQPVVVAPGGHKSYQIGFSCLDAGFS